MNAKKVAMMTMMSMAVLTFGANPAAAFSFCVGFCFQSGAPAAAVEGDIAAVTQTNSNVQTCAGNVQVGISVHGDNQQCEQTNYSCNANAANGAGSNCTKPVDFA